MNLRKLTAEEVEFTVHADPMEESPKGYFCSGDDEQDRRDEEWILAELERGNEYAWCIAVVTAEWQPEPDGTTYRGSDALSGVSCRSEKEFHELVRYHGMYEEALEDLNREIETAMHAHEIGSLLWELSEDERIDLLRHLESIQNSLQEEDLNAAEWLSDPDYDEYAFDWDEPAITELHYNTGWVLGFAAAHGMKTMAFLARHKIDPNRASEELAKLGPF